MLNRRLSLLARSAKTSLDHFNALRLSREKPSLGFQLESSTSHVGGILIGKCIGARPLNGGNFGSSLLNRYMTTLGHPEKTNSQDESSSVSDILDKEAVEEVREQREIPDIQPGYIVQLKVEVPENKRRLSTLKGIVIARRNAGLHTTFRMRRMVAGVGVESVFPL
ncbi:hypothetical protein Sjap_020944 [Stephania japonica]|uniref:Ribosomal protein L19 n=1 Tax=Stephania japonica TaxID=461633 RepID=A0AAP0F1P0_9MAGN